jgi:rhodanese-related sulfurtransferase
MNRSAVIFFVACCAALLSFYQTPVTYRCLPCGNACDDARYDKPGTCPSCGMRLVDESTIHFKTLDFLELCNRLKANKNIILLDVRSPQEFNNTVTDRDSFGKFKNAININVTELEQRVGELAAYKNREVIVYCSHSHRSPEASYFLSTHGFRNVENVAGGVSTFNTSNGADCLRDQFIGFH